MSDYKHIQMRPLSTEKGKAYYEFDLNAANYLKHKKLYFDLKFIMDLKNKTLQSIYEMKSESYSWLVLPPFLK